MAPLALLLGKSRTSCCCQNLILTDNLMSNFSSPFVRGVLSVHGKLVHCGLLGLRLQHRQHREGGVVQQAIYFFH